jgi:hypothetical protein
MITSARRRLSWHRRGWRRPISHRLIGHRTHRSLRRDLWAMAAALAAEAPKLKSMFEMFNLLTRYERPMGIEPLASSAPLLTAAPRPAPRSAPLMARGPSRTSRGPSRTDGPHRTRLGAMVALGALAVVVAVCLVISTHVRPVARSCLVATSAGLTGLRLSHAPGCAAYPARK